MKIGAALSLDPDPSSAGRSAASEAASSLNGEVASLAVVIASPHHLNDAKAVLDAVHDAASPQRVIGCVAETVVAGRREVEEGPAVAVWLGAFPSRAETFHMEFVQTSEAGVFGGWRFDMEPGGAYLLVTDPYSFPADLLLRHLNDHVPGTLVMGGQASGATRPGGSQLFLDKRVLDSGAVGAHLSGVDVQMLVSQGCRPIGRPYTVTKVEENLILELAGQPPLLRLQRLFGTLSEDDRTLLAQGLHVGRVIDEYKERPGRGDFLVRGVIGADRATGAIAVGDHLEVGETVQFHVRDAKSADEDLRSLLDGLVGKLGTARPAGALLFTCNGRGSRMFGVPDHDATVVGDMLGDLPLTGFFAQGELGPIGGKNFVHGYTASLALLVEE